MTICCKQGRYTSTHTHTHADWPLYQRPVKQTECISPLYFTASVSLFTATAEITHTALHFLLETMCLFVCFYMHMHVLCVCFCTCPVWVSSVSLCVCVFCVPVCACLSVYVLSQFSFILCVSSSVFGLVFSHTNLHAHTVTSHGKKAFLCRHISSKKPKQTIENARALNRTLLSPDWSDHIHHFGPSCC